MRFGVTEDGFVRKTYNDILEEMQARAREKFGEDINLSSSSFLGMHLQNEAWTLATVWEMAEDVYYSAYVDFSEGSSLDNVGKYITVTRRPAQRSRGTITIEGTEGTRINEGFRIATKGLDKVFETTRSARISDSKKVEIPIRSVSKGSEMNVAPHSIVKVVNPISGVSKVYNKDVTVGGLNIEPDAEFRERYYRSPSRGGSSTRESVEATLLDMDDVTDAFVEENETMETLDGIPPKSLAPYVFGGKDKEVAETILSTKAGGIRSYGETTVETVDSKGRYHTIGFTRPNIKDTHVTLNIDPNDGYVGDEVVTRAVINYIGGEDKDGIAYEGLKLGQDVVISKILAHVMSLQGIRDLDVKVSVDGVDFADNNIKVAKKEIARTRYDKVVVNHV